MAKRPAQFSSETQFLTEEDITNEGEDKIDLPYFEKIQGVLAGEPIINTVLFQINQQKEKKKFISGRCENPNFIIRETMTWGKFKERMEILDFLEKDIKTESNIALKKLYLDKIKELRHQLEIRLAAGKDTKTLFEASLKLWGRPTAKDFQLALEERRKKDNFKPKGEKKERIYNAQEICLVFNRAIKELGFPRWQASVSSSAAAITDDQKNPSGPKIRIPTGKEATPERLEELVQHEIVTHIGRGRSGQLSKLALIGFMGADHYLTTEEGLATFTEQEIAIKHGRKPSSIGLDRTIAMGAALEGRNFRETYEYLLVLGITEDLAWENTRRVFRGISDASKSDGRICTLDWVYHRGNLEVRNFVRTKGEAGLDQLWIGKIGIHHLKIMSKLALTKPVLPYRLLEIQDLLKGI